MLEIQTLRSKNFGLVHLEFFFFSPFVIFEPLAALCVMVDSRVGLGA